MNGANSIEEVCRKLHESLTSDIVSIGEARQIAQNFAVGTTSFTDFLRSVLVCLLNSGVEIGYAVNPTGSYVEFVAWRGTPEMKVSRLLAEMARNEKDFDFTVWLALAPNVDRYE